MEVTKEMFNALAEGRLFTLGSSGEEPDCRVIQTRPHYNPGNLDYHKTRKNAFQESQALIATPSLSWVGRGGSDGNLTRYILRVGRPNALMYLTLE